MNISTRDKLILKWFGIFLAAIALVYFGIFNLGNELQRVSTLHSELEAKRQLVEATLPTYPQVKATERLAEHTLATRLNRYLRPSTSDGVEAFMIPLLLPYNIQLDYFSRTETQVVVPTTTLTLQPDPAYRLKVLIDEFDATPAKDTTLPTTESDILRTQVTYRLSLGFEDYRRLIDGIAAADKALYLSASVYDFKDAAATLTFDLYMSDAPNLLAQ